MEPLHQYILKMSMNEKLCEKEYENEHSKRIRKILSYEDDKGNFPLLQSFVDEFLFEYKDDITVREPVITFNKEYIDIWIRDDDYAIIVENKVNGAPDGSKQIDNYFKKTKEEYSENEIFVLYISEDENDEPSVQTFGKHKQSISKHFSKICSKDLRKWVEKISKRSDIQDAGVMKVIKIEYAILLQKAME